MRTLIHEWVDAARAGSNPLVVGRLKSGWAVVGEPQNLPGYCLLLPDPVVSCLNDLAVAARCQFLSDMALLGDAVARAFHPVRLNYEILGNTEPALHAHIFPRYGWEPKVMRTKPVWFYYPWWRLRPVRSATALEATMTRLRAALTELA